MLSVIMLSVITLNVYAECHYTEYHYSESHYAESHYAECHYAECHYAECHYAECHYAECHYAECYYAEYHCADCCYAECRSAGKMIAFIPSARLGLKCFYEPKHSSLLLQKSLGRSMRVVQDEKTPLLKISISSLSLFFNGNLVSLSVGMLHQGILTEVDGSVLLTSSLR
jgi:hypothetical protein